MPRIILATVGSLGDLHPFIALGLALKVRGADVVVVSAVEYRTKVERAGLAFRPVRPSFDDMQQHLGMNRAQLTAAVLARGDFLFRRLVIPGVRPSYEDMLPIVSGADMLLTSSLAFGARLAAEKNAVPWTAIVLQPLMFLSAFDPPVVPQAQWLARMLRYLGPGPTAFVLELLKRAVDRLLGPVHALRHDIGLAPNRQNPLFEGQFSAAGAIALYSGLLGSIRPDYPRPTAIVGFACFDSDEGAAAPMTASLREFLAAGPAPLVFTLGSLIVNSPGSFYRESLAAARRLGRRAVLLVGADAIDGYASWRSADVCIAAYAPYSQLFSRAAAITHQGGIGTLAQALRSGRPQLIVPFFADQLDNAARAVKLGVARALSPKKYDAVSASRELALLLSPAGGVARAAAVRDLLKDEDGASRAADLVMNRLESRAG